MGKIANIFEGDHPINWDLARTELDLIIFRSTCGLTEDKRYLQYAKACNVPYGVFHYVTATNAEDSRKQAQFFVKYANSAYKKPLFYIADIEGDRFNSTNTEPVCVAFLNELRKLGCKKIGLYINRKYKYAGKAIDMCDIMWIPHWGLDDGNIPADEYKPEHYNDLWQYTSNGRMLGLDEDVDLNILNGDKPLEYFTEGWVPDPMPEYEKFTNMHFVDFCKKFVGMPYWYATCVYPCTESKLQSKKKSYPDHYTSKRMDRYRADIAAHKICADCVGLMKGYAWTNAGENVIESIGKEKPLFTNKYKSNNMPDKSANGMFSYVKSQGLDWGNIDTLPEIPGLGLHMNGHVGVYIGNGYAIEERGFDYGCVKTKIKDRKWLHWFKIPSIIYPDTSEPKKEEELIPQPQPIVKDKEYITTASVNVRNGDNTSYEKITTLIKNTKLNVVMDKNDKPIISKNGWYAIYITDKIGWLSGNYIKENN